MRRIMRGERACGDALRSRSSKTRYRAMVPVVWVIRHRDLGAIDPRENWSQAAPCLNTGYES